MLTRPRAHVTRLMRAGFTLIELLAVMLIIGILAAFLVPNIVDYVDTAQVRACEKNLQEIYSGLINYKGKYDRIPSGSGVAFFADLVAGGAMSNTKSNARRLTCPAVEITALAIKDYEPEEWWIDLERLDGTWSAYAGRDCERFPLRKFPGDGTEPLVADDNDGGLDVLLNHTTTTNVLYTDGSVEGYELFELRKEGVVGGEEVLPVGPDSPIEDLRKFSLD